MSTPCAICPDLPCEFPSDLDLYSLDGLQYFLNGEYFFVLDCPPGYDCYNWPVNWRIPPGRLPPITPPPRRPGTTYDFTLRLKCCGSDVVGTVHVVSTMTTDQYNAELKRVVDAMFFQCARLQAECDAVEELKPKPPPPTPGTPDRRLQFKIGNLSPNICCVNSPFFGSVAVVTSFPAVTFSLLSGAFPTGVTMNVVSPKGIVIAGTPTSPGTSTFTIQVLYGSWSSQKTFTIDVVGITNASTLPDASVGTFYSQQLTGTGGTAPYTFSTAVLLPSGLSLATDGTISGTPTANGAYTFDVTLTDANGRQCTQTVALTVLTTCSGFPSSIAAMTWVTSTSPSPLPGNNHASGSMTGGAGSGLLQLDYTGFDLTDEVALYFTSHFCNSTGAAITLTAQATYVSSGDVFTGGSHVYRFVLIVLLDGVVQNTMEGDIRFDLPNPLTASLQVAAHTTSQVDIEIFLQCAPGPPAGFARVNATISLS